MEIQYVDLDEGETGAVGGTYLGSIGQVGSFYEKTSHTKVSVDATVLSAVLFIPEASPVGRRMLKWYALTLDVRQ